jgi:heat shock 70kDa protein 1/2/6/8
VATWIHDHSFVIPNEYGNLTTPSYVAFTNTGVLVGEAAKYQASVNPTNTVYDIKRLIGRKFSDPDVQADMKFWPFRVVRGPFDKPLIEVTFRHKLTRFAPEEISALMYHHMKKVAESFFRCAVQNAVITVPAPFDDSQRHATKDAAIISGLNVLRIVDESTAATLAAGWSDKEKISVVFDFGGGLANASLSVSEHGVVEVKSISGDDHLGGEDFDNRLVSHCVEDIKRRLHKDVTVSQVAIHRLRVACERAKRELSFQREATVEIDNLIDGISYSVTISRAQFERMCVDLFEKAVGIASTLLNSIRMPFPKHHVHQILLTGGCTRIPKVRQVLREYFDDRELSRTLNPDIAVAKGAALQVALLAGLDRSGALDDFLLLDVVSYSLGLILPDGSLREMIPRSCSLPCKKLRLMTIPATFCSESSLVLRVAAGESRDCSGCWVLGEIVLDGLTPDTAGNWEIEVTFDVDSGNALVVTAAEKSSGRESEMTISNDAGRISTSELRKMMLTFSEIVEIDRSEAQRVSAKCRFENYLHAVERVLFDEALSLTPAEVNACERVFHHAVVWLDSRFDGGCEVEFENKLVWLQSELPESVRCRVSCHGVASTAAHRRAVDLCEVD